MKNDLKKIGVIHSNYRSNSVSGENLAVSDMRRILELAGFESDPWETFSDDISGASSEMKTLYREIIRDPKAHDFREWLTGVDALQLHNLFPALSRNNLKQLQNSNHFLVRVIHNHRLTCINGLEFRDNKKCAKCFIHQSRLPGVVHGCYQDSKVKSSAISYLSNISDFYLKDRIDLYVAVSDYVKNYLGLLKIPQDRIRVIPNVIEERIAILPEARHVMFAGRLDESKGFDLVIEAWTKYSDLPILNVMGDGKLKRSAESHFSKDNRVIFHGNVSPKRLEEIASTSCLTLIPSKVNETFGKSAAEALARGQSCVILPNGGLSELLNCESVSSFSDLDLGSFYCAIKERLEKHGELTISQGRTFWEDKFSPKRVSSVWKEVYAG